MTLLAIGVIFFILLVAGLIALAYYDDRTECLQAHVANRDGWEAVVLYLPPIREEHTRDEVVAAGEKLRVLLGARYHPDSEIDWSRSSLRTGEITVLLPPKGAT